MRLMITDEDGTIRHFEQRASGRTRAILTKALASPFSMILIVSPFPGLSGHNQRKFEEILTERSIKFTAKKGQVYIGCTTFVFREEAWLEDSTNWRGLPAFDIYRDHTCFERR